MSTVDELAVEAQGGNEDAVLELWKSVEKFVRLRAKRYTEQAEISDLLQSGFEALYAALTGYSPGRGAFLPFYAFYLPRAFRSAVFGDTSEAARRDPIINALRLDAPAGGDDENDELIDLLPDEASAEAFSDAERDELSEAVQDAVRTLQPAERRVIFLRFWGGLTAQQTAQVLHISMTEAQKIERNALRQLRHPQTSKALRKYL